MELPGTTPDTIGARQHPGVENHRQTNHTMPKNPVNALYAEFGWYRNDLKSFTFEGESGMRTMRSIMDSLRRDKPVSVGGYRVAEIVDYAEEGTGLPKANVLEFHFMNGAKLMVRPSSTEPKIKIYLSAVAHSAVQAVLPVSGYSLEVFCNRPRKPQP